MLKIVELVVLDALNHNNPAKTRDYLYFKKYLLNSTIWFQSVKNYPKKRDKKNNNSNSNGETTILCDFRFNATIFRRQ